MSMSKKHVTIVLTIAAIALLAAITAAGAVAQDNNTTAEEEAPLYENSSEPNIDRWLDGVEPDLGGLVTMTGRLGTFVVGGGGSGVNGSLLSGILVMGLAVGAVASVGVGSIAGVVLAVAGVFAGVATGIAPQWTSGVLMFGVGLVLASVFRRVLN